MLQFLARLILLLVAISVLRRIIKIALSFWAGLGHSSARPSVSRPPSSGDPNAHLSLAQDPVCGTYVATENSLKRIVKGKVLHFCSVECKDRYEE